MTIQYIQKHIKNINSITYKCLYWIFSTIEKERHKNTQFQNLYNSKKTRMNIDCDRADSRFSNVTQCDKKCNILNI